MPKLTPQQRAKLVRYYYLNRESPTEALRAYGQSIRIGLFYRLEHIEKNKEKIKRKIKQ